MDVRTPVIGPRTKEGLSYNPAVASIGGRRMPRMLQPRDIYGSTATSLADEQARFILDTALFAATLYIAGALAPAASIYVLSNRILIAANIHLGFMVAPWLAMKAEEEGYISSNTLRTVLLGLEAGKMVSAGRGLVKATSGVDKFSSTVSFFDTTGSSFSEVERIKAEHALSQQVQETATNQDTGFRFYEVNGAVGTTGGFSASYNSSDGFSFGIFFGTSF